MLRLLIDFFTGRAADDLEWQPESKTCGNCGKLVHFIYYFTGFGDLVAQRLDAEKLYEGFSACLSCSASAGV
jgi:hypothetical protein